MSRLLRLKRRVKGLDEFVPSNPRGKHRKPRRPAWRIGGLPAWLPPVLIAAAAAAGYGAGESGWRLTNEIERSAPVRARGAHAVGGGRVVETHRRFRQCGGVHQTFCVIDGDTVRVDGERIRLADIDTPEIGGAQCGAERRLGERAKRRLIELLNDGSFTVARTGARDRDSYGRPLRVLARGGRSLGDTLIDEGLARPWRGARQSWCS
jgi:hypothetical protein